MAREIMSTNLQAGEGIPSRTLKYPAFAMRTLPKNVVSRMPTPALRALLRNQPLRSRRDERKARELKRAEEVRKAAGSGEITIDKPGVVVNMPLLTWPGGRR